MSLLTWIIIFSLLGGVLSVMVASTFLLLPANVRSRLVPHLVSFAIGSLLGAAFLGLLPHALVGSGIGYRGQYAPDRCEFRRDLDR